MKFLPLINKTLENIPFIANRAPISLSVSVIIRVKTYPNNTALFKLISILFIILFSYYKDYKKKKEIKNDNMINYLLFVSVIALGTLSIKTGAFWRFESIVVLFSPVIFVRLLENKNNFNKIIPYFYIFGIIHFLINILFQINNLTGVGFITTIQKFLTTSLIEVLYSFVKGLLNLF